MEWLKAFTWLRKVPNNPHKASCSVCNCELSAEITALKRHNTSQSHIKKFKTIPTSQKTLLQFTTKVGDDGLEKRTQKAEIKVTEFFVEHNIPFSVADHMTPLMKKCFPDSKIAQKFVLGRTKATNIVKNVIAKTQKEDLIEKLKTHQFSVLTDESTDISCTKTACILVRYFDFDDSEVKTRFWNLANVFDHSSDSNDTNFADVANATAQNLFEAITKSCEEYDIPLENFIGFASDGANTMMGAQNSVASRFRAQCPGITIIKCICHSLHLVASDACKQLPRHCEDLARDVFNFFSTSSKRQAELKNFQMFFDVDVHRMLHPSQTRWLSVHEVVKRMLEQWDLLIIFFTEKQKTERLITIQNILKSLQDPFLKLCFKFLSWVLPKFANANLFFQSTKSRILDLDSTLTNLYKELLLSFMDRMYVNNTKLQDIDPNDSARYVPLESMYLGAEITNLLLVDPELKDKNDLKNNFFKCARQFLITACEGLKKRYDFNNEIFSSITIFQPCYALHDNLRNEIPSLVKVASYFPRISSKFDLQQLDDDWRILSTLKLPEEINDKLDTESFWIKLLNLKNAGGEMVLKSLPKFVLTLLSLPHANADCERIFSRINLIKVKTRNRLITSTVDSCLLSADSLKENNQTCYDYDPPDKMLNKMSTKILYATQSQKEKSLNITFNEEDYIQDEEEDVEIIGISEPGENF